MKKIRVGLFFGGVDQEREVSINSAQTVREHLDTNKYTVKNIEIMPDESFVVDGVATSQDEACAGIDVAVLALHGLFGEDGTMQRLLDEHSVPHTGSDALASAVGFSKLLTKKVFDNFKIQTPTYIQADRDECTTPQELSDKAGEIFSTFPQPCVIKPTSAGSSLGVSICGNKTEIKAALKKAFAIGKLVVIEEYIEGCETTVGVIDGFRGEEIYALPAVEIIPPTGRFYDEETKYDGSTMKKCPAQFEEEVKEKLADIARKVHSSIHLKDYSRTDFIIHPRRGIFALEVNTLPGMAEQSLFPRELAAVGISISEFLDHIIQRNL